MRIRTLDGLRGVSILLVVFGDSLFALPDTNGVRRALSFTYPWGGAGVSIFFGISGHIITRLLVQEKERSGKIELAQFYMRRAFRILPPLWAFILAGALIATWIPARDWFATLLFVTNYIPVPHWIGHTWSLSVEEQFYVLWPLVLWALGTRRAFRFCVAMVVLAPIIRGVALWVSQTPLNYQNFHLAFDALAMGVVLAILRQREQTHWFLRLTSHRLVLWCSVLILAFGYHAFWRLGGVLGLDLNAIFLSVQALSVACVLNATLSEADPILCRALRSRPLVSLGVLSYSLYLWQQPFYALALGGTFEGIWPIPMLASFPLAWFSYRYIELPALRLRDHIVKRRTRTGSDVVAGQR